MAFARGACVAPIFVGLFHSRPKGVAHFSFFITGACLPRWLIETSGLALNTQEGRDGRSSLQRLLETGDVIETLSFDATRSSPDESPSIPQDDEHTRFFGLTLVCQNPWSTGDGTMQKQKRGLYLCCRYIIRYYLGTNLESMDGPRHPRKP